MDLTVRVRPSDQGTVVQVGGDLDIETNSSFQEILRYVLRSYSPRLLLDLANVPFMDCAGLGSLVLTRRRAEMRKGRCDSPLPPRQFAGLSRQPG